MGFFGDVQDKVNDKYVNEVLDHIRPADGKVHVLCFDLNAKHAMGEFRMDKLATNVVDLILGELQDHDREIVGVKLGYAMDNAWTNRSIQILYK